MKQTKPRIPLIESHPLRAQVDFHSRLWATGPINPAAQMHFLFSHLPHGWLGIKIRKKKNTLSQTKKRPQLPSARQHKANLSRVALVAFTIWHMAYYSDYTHAPSIHECRPKLAGVAAHQLPRFGLGFGFGCHLARASRGGCNCRSSAAVFGHSNGTGSMSWPEKKKTYFMRVQIWQVVLPR